MPKLKNLLNPVKAVRFVKRHVFAGSGAPAASADGAAESADDQDVDPGASTTTQSSASVTAASSRSRAGLGAPLRVDEEETADVAGSEGDGDDANSPVAAQPAPIPLQSYITTVGPAKAAEPQHGYMPLLTPQEIAQGAMSAMRQEDSASASDSTESSGSSGRERSSSSDDPNSRMSMESSEEYEWTESSESSEDEAPEILNLKDDRNPSLLGKEKLEAYKYERQGHYDESKRLRSRLGVDAEGRLVAGQTPIDRKVGFVASQNRGEVHEFAIGPEHHTYPIRGEAAAAAGEMLVAQGVVRTVTDRSGHYQPTPEMTHQFVAALQRLGVQMTDKSLVATGPDGQARPVSAAELALSSALKELKEAPAPQTEGAAPKPEQLEAIKASLRIRLGQALAVQAEQERSVALWQADVLAWEREVKDQATQSSEVDESESAGERSDSDSDSDAAIFLESSASESSESSESGEPERKPLPEALQARLATLQASFNSAVAQFAQLGKDAQALGTEGLADFLREISRDQGIAPAMKDAQVQLHNPNILFADEAWGAVAGNLEAIKKEIIRRTGFRGHEDPAHLALYPDPWMPFPDLRLDPNDMVKVNEWIRTAERCGMFTEESSSVRMQAEQFAQTGGNMKAIEAKRLLVEAIKAGGDSGVVPDPRPKHRNERRAFGATISKEAEDPTRNPYLIQQLGGEEGLRKLGVIRPELLNDDEKVMILSKKRVPTGFEHVTAAGKPK